MARPRRSRYDRFQDQAAAQALVRYGPETRGIQELLAQAQGDYGAEVRQAQAGSAGMTRAIDVQRPLVNQAYGDLLRGTQQRRQVLDADLAGVPTTSNALRAAVATERAGHDRRFQEQQTRENVDLAARRTEAQNAGVFGAQQARSRFLGTRDKLQRQLLGVQQEMGTYTAGQMGQLSSEAAQRGLQNRMSLRQVRSSERIAGANNRLRAETLEETKRSNRADEGIKRAEAERKRREKARNGGLPRATRGEHNRLTDEVGRALPIAQAGKRKGRDRGTIGRTLLEGIPSTPVQEGGRTVGRTPEIRPVSPTAATVALDMAAFGYIRQSTVAKLHEQGYSVRALGGLPTEAQKRAQERRQRRLTPRQTGQLQSMTAPIRGLF